MLCPKCGGKMFVEADHHGKYLDCVLCGHTEEIPEPPKPIDQTDWTRIMNQTKG